MLENLRYRIIRAGITLIRFTPYPLALGLLRGGGMLLWALDPFHRRIAETQMRHALGNDYRKGMSRRVFMNHGDILVDTIKYAYMDDERIKAAIAIEGREKLAAAISSGRGVLLITGHISNWEILANMQRLTGVKVKAMADIRPDQAAEKAINELRTRAGALPLPPRGGMLKTLTGALSEGEVVTIVIDQRGDRANILFCDVFGLPAPTTPVPAWLALKSDALVLPVHPVKKAGRYTITFSDPIDPRDFLEGETLPESYRHYYKSEAVQRLSDAMQQWLEGVVRANPAQWFWLNSRWTRRSNLRRLQKNGADFAEFIVRQRKTMLENFPG